MCGAVLEEKQRHWSKCVLPCNFVISCFVFFGLFVVFLLQWAKSSTMWHVSYLVSSAHIWDRMSRLSICGFQREGVKICLFYSCQLNDYLSLLRNGTLYQKSGRNYLTGLAGTDDLFSYDSYQLVWLRCGELLGQGWCWCRVRGLWLSVSDKRSWLSKIQVLHMPNSRHHKILLTTKF